MHKYASKKLNYVLKRVVELSSVEIRSENDQNLRSLEQVRLSSNLL